MGPAQLQALLRLNETALNLHWLQAAEWLHGGLLNFPKSMIVYVVVAEISSSAVKSLGMIC